MCTPIHHYWTLKLLLEGLHFAPLRRFFFLSVAKGLPASMRAEWGFSFKGKKAHFLFKTYHAFFLPVAPAFVKYWKLLSVPLSQLLKAVLFIMKYQKPNCKRTSEHNFLLGQHQTSVWTSSAFSFAHQGLEKKKWLREPYRGAFASLTSHTLFFQMNLRLFLSKSLQK